MVALAVPGTGILAEAAAARPGPPSFSMGLAGEPTFQSSSSSVRSFWLRRAQTVGSSFVRLSVHWVDIAPARPTPGFHAANPADPHYNWSSLDAPVRDAVAHGQAVLLMVFDAPAWAQGPGIPASVIRGTWFPSSSAFGAFAHAIAARYSGHFRDPRHRHQTLPRVRYFQAWNEPNLPNALMPQWVRDTSSGAILPESPVLYRRLLNAFYAGVKSAQPTDYVISAGTAPYGDPPGGNRMMPVTFLRALFCLIPGAGSCANPPHFDALDHHPYAATPTWHAQLGGDIAVPDLYKLWNVLHQAERLHRVAPAGPKPLWVTEIDWSSGPATHPQRAQQAHYLSLAMYELWSQDVSHVAWFFLRDTPFPQKSFVNSGLYDLGARAKPAAAAYRFPFVALPFHSKYILWGKAPGPGTVVIEEHTGGGWRALLQLRADSTGVFYARRSLRHSPELRARMRATVSPPWVAGY